MAYENINLRKANMTLIDGYFYFFDNEWDTLVQKVDDGEIAFTYPLHTVITNPVISLEHDGINFWTLQDGAAGEAVIKRWQIENNICELKDTTTLSPGFDSDAFTVEHYHTGLVSTISGGNTIIQTSAYYSTVIVGGTVLTLGPNSSEQYEDVDVVSVSGTDITLASGVQYTHESSTGVNFYNNFWVFNKTDDGTLHKVNARTGVNITTYSGIIYDNITACTFARISNVFSSNVDTLIYQQSSALRFVNIDTLANYGVATIDNQRVDTTIIPAYDLAVYGSTAYRLHSEANYYEVDVNWGSVYNYVTSPIRRFVNSITVTAYPVIVPANGRNVLEIQAQVLDQYGTGVVDKPVSFTDDDSAGYITTTPVYTDVFGTTGIAKTYYRAGTVPRTVNVEGTVTQYD